MRAPRHVTTPSGPARSRPLCGPCGSVPIDPNARWPTAILTKIVTSFSTSGDRIILLQGPAPIGGPTDHSPAVQSDAELASALVAINDLHRPLHVIHFPVNSDGLGIDLATFGR